jgi:iron complex outermembrane receptor protein
MLRVSVLLSRYSVFTIAMWFSIPNVYAQVAPGDGASKAPVGNEAAQTPLTSSNNGLEEIVVTAQKREQSVDSVGMTINAVTGEQLMEQGVKNLADLIKIEPSFTVAQNSVGQPVYSIRGIGYNSTSLGAPPAVSIYVDEVAYPYAAMAKGATLDLERVEVLKGPQGTLFGENATGGAVNYIAAKPTDKLEFGVDVSYARFNEGTLDGFVSGPITDALKARLAFSVDEGGAWQRSTTRDDTLGDKNNKFVRLLLDWVPTDRLKVSLNLNGWTDNSQNQAPALSAVALEFPARASLVSPQILVASIAPDNDPRAADWTLGTHPANDEDFYQASLRLDYRLSNAINLTYLGTYEHFNSDDLLSFTGSDTPFDETEQAHVQTMSHEVRLSGRLNDDDNGHDLEWVVGGTYSQDKDRENSILRVTGTTTSYSLVGLPGITQPLAVVNPFMTQNVDSKAAFGNIEYHLLPNLSVHAGARYTKTDNDHTGCTRAGDQNGADSFTELETVLRGGVGIIPVQVGGCASLNPATLQPALLVDSLDQHNVSWRFGIDWTPIEKTLLYATASRGFKAGSFPNIATATNYSLKPVTQELVTAYELGFKSRPFGNRLQLDGAIFYYDYKDKQQELPELDPLGVFGLLNSVLNVPKSDVRGVELTVKYIPLQGLTLQAAVTYLDSEVTGDFMNYDQFSNPINFKGEPLPNTPKWAFSVGPRYDWDFNSSYSAFVAGDVRYTSMTQSYFGAEEAASAGYPSEVNKAYTLLNLRAGINSEDGHWRYEVFGDNVTNTYYTTQSVRVDTVARYVGMPATFGIRVGYRY